MKRKGINGGDYASDACDAVPPACGQMCFVPFPGKLCVFWKLKFPKKWEEESDWLSRWSSVQMVIWPISGRIARALVKEDGLDLKMWLIWLIWLVWLIGFIWADLLVNPSHIWRRDSHLGNASSSDKITYNRYLYLFDFSFFSQSWADIFVTKASQPTPDWTDSGSAQDLNNRLARWNVRSFRTSCNARQQERASNFKVSAFADNPANYLQLTFGFRFSLK